MFGAGAIQHKKAAAAAARRPTPARYPPDMLELEDLLSDGELDVSEDEAAAPATTAATAPAFDADDLGLAVPPGAANKKWSLDDLESCSEDDESEPTAVNEQPPTSALTTPPKRDATQRQPVAGGLLSPPKALAPSHPAASRVGRVASPPSPVSPPSSSVGSTRAWPG